MSALSDAVLSQYLRSHQELLEAETEDENTVTVSFPLYYSANHRIELSVTKLPTGDFLVSDDGKTVGELKLAGVPIGSKTKERLLRLTKNADVRFVDGVMVRECKPEQVGQVLHLFADAAKTAGDAYLAYRQRVVAEEDELHKKVKEILVRNNYRFREFDEIKGEVETHQVDFYVPKNGIPPVALSVLPRPTRLTAEAWAFKSSDMKAVDTALRVGIVYGAESLKDEQAKEVIRKKIDLPISSTDLDLFGQGLAPLLKGK